MKVNTVIAASRVDRYSKKALTVPVVYAAAATAPNRNTYSVLNIAA